VKTLTRIPAARRLLPFATVAVLLLAIPPDASAFTTRYPTQSLGNRGSDVKAAQGFLVARGYVTPADGIFGALTRSAVVAFQASRGLTANGVVADATWARLVITVRPGDRAQAVRVLQSELNEKRRSGLTVDGYYGAPTRTAVLAFQRHMSITANGVVGGQTWRALLWHYELPSFNATSLCDYSVGNGAANWATGDSIGQLEGAARAFAALGHGRVSVGDAGFEHGGNIPGHNTHEVGLDVDVRPIRKAEDQCRWGTNWRSSTYDRTVTRALIRTVRAAAPGHVKLIYFNDPVLIREGLTTWYSGHDDHLHIRYCETGYAVARYRC
jgi:peptidoglycan hydrolase-like protein with peptidoglycan-binding domain